MVIGFGNSFDILPVIVTITVTPTDESRSESPSTSLLILLSSLFILSLLPLCGKIESRVVGSNMVGDFNIICFVAFVNCPFFTEEISIGIAVPSPFFFADTGIFSFFEEAVFEFVEF